MDLCQKNHTGQAWCKKIMAILNTFYIQTTQTYSIPLIQHLSLYTKFISPMSAYFKLRCFDQDSSKKILYVGTAILAVLTIFHFAYSGVLGTVTNLQSSNATLFQPVMAYFITLAFQQIAVCIGVLLILCGAVDQHATSFGFKLMFALLLANLCLNFAAAVSTGLKSSYLTYLFSPYLSSESNDALTVKIKAACGFTTFECIITFILAIPIDLTLLLALTHQFWNHGGKVYGEH